MKEKQCEECGTIIPEGAISCPNCGCPVENTQENEQTDKNDGQAGSAFIHDNFNEKEPYSPFKSDSWFFRDPWPMYNYPKGALYKKYPLIDWLLGPWYLTCRNEKDQEEYDIINNIFYFFNLIFKIIAYALVWSLFKIWWLILGLIILSAIKGFIINSILQSLMNPNLQATLATTIGIIAIVVFIAALVFSLIVESCAMGKAFHRYWPQLHKTFRKLNKRYWNAMLDKK